MHQRFRSHDHSPHRTGSKSSPTRHGMNNDQLESSAATEVSACSDPISNVQAFVAQVVEKFREAHSLSEIVRCYRSAYSDLQREWRPKIGYGCEIPGGQEIRQAFRTGSAGAITKGNTCADGAQPIPKRPRRKTARRHVHTVRPYNLKGTSTTITHSWIRLPQRRRVLSK